MVAVVSRIGRMRRVRGRMGGNFRLACRCSRAMRSAVGECGAEGFLPAAGAVKGGGVDAN